MDAADLLLSYITCYRVYSSVWEAGMTWSTTAYYWQLQNRLSITVTALPPFYLQLPHVVKDCHHSTL